jgi:hypothetical protein
MAAPLRIVLYGNGLFTDANASVNQQHLEAIQNSGFNTVILWTLHVDPQGNLDYNGPPFTVENGELSSEFQSVVPYVTQLRQGGVNTVLFCIGSADVADYAHIASLLQSEQGAGTLLTNLAAVVQAFGLNGFDFDLEEFDQDYRPTIVQLTSLLRNYGLVTFCPYTDGTQWTNTFWEDSLLGSYQNNNVQAVAWENLQCYSGGSGNTGAQWAQQITGYGQPLGIDNANAFIVPGYSASEQSPSSIQTTLSGQNVGGGFIWNSGAIFQGSYTPAQYAQAIIKGIGEGQQPKKKTAR